MPPPTHHVEFALYADDMAIIATSRKPTLLVSYLESYLDDLQRCLSEWIIAIMSLKHRDNLRECWMAFHPAPTSNTLGGTNRMGRKTRYLGGETTHLDVSLRPGQKEDCSKYRESDHPSGTESCYISSSSGP